jgi:hypothetical protein
MDRQHRDAVIVRQPLERLGVLADRIRPDHHLDAVVAEARGDLEGGGRRLGIDRRRRQGDLCRGDPDDCHGLSLPQAGRA